MPNGDEPYTGYTDASRSGLRCVLMQHGQVIAYASRQLKPYEKNYPIPVQDLAAVIFALRTKRCYFYSIIFELYTNCQLPDYQVLVYPKRPQSKTTKVG